jgi:hypothetical protein
VAEFKKIVQNEHGYCGPWFAETGFATVSIPVHSPAKELDESKRISVGIGLGMVVLPDVRGKTNPTIRKK